MFRKSEQEDVSHVSEKDIKAKVIHSCNDSTPGSPGSSWSLSRRNQKRLVSINDYTWITITALNRIYSRAEIEKARMSPSWEREFCLKFSGRIGNLLSQKIIDDSIIR